jgi:hypothetical protein
MDLNTLLVVGCLCIPFVLATFWAVLDAAQKEFGCFGHKAAWMLVGAVPFIGFVIYLIFGFKKGKPPGSAPSPEK